MTGRGSTRGPSNEPYEQQLAFINISDINSISDPAQQQSARSQAIRHALQRKQRRLRLSSDNFVNATSSSLGRLPSRPFQNSQDEPADEVVELPRRSASFQSGTVDPFETLTINPAIDSERFARLLQSSTAKQAGEPVFSVNYQTEHQRLSSIFEEDLNDAAFSSALYLTLVFAANGGVMDQECYAYRSKAIQHVSSKLSDPVEAASSTTVGSVLLMIGVELRLGERDVAQIHLNGISQLLDLCNKHHTYLHPDVKRAMFWQDVFTAVIAGTDRIFSHETFPEFHWQRDPYQEDLYAVPVGFGKRSEILGMEFLTIIGDICALQRIRESGTSYPFDREVVEQVSTQQAWVESRLQQLSRRTNHPLLLCCIPAAFLCAYSFFAEVWSAGLIPSHLSSQLLRQLQASENWDGWDEHADVLLWLLNIGNAFAIDDPIRHAFGNLWQGHHKDRLQPLASSWDIVEDHLRMFIWSDIFYDSQSGTFWERLQRE